MVRLVPFFGHKFRGEREWDEVNSSAQDDLVGLGDDIRGLDIDISMPGAARRPGIATSSRYRPISEPARSSTAPTTGGSRTGERDARGGSVRDGVRQGAARGSPAARAPSAVLLRSSSWPLHRGHRVGPLGRGPTAVPACAADATRIKDGFAPHGRQVDVNGRPTDYWNAPGHYGPMMGGYFGGFGGGGLISALFMGSALGCRPWPGRGDGRRPLRRRRWRRGCRRWRRRRRRRRGWRRRRWRRLRRLRRRRLLRRRPVTARAACHAPPR